jgi:hypothetical protein
VRCADILCEPRERERIGFGGAGQDWTGSIHIRVCVRFCRYGKKRTDMNVYATQVVCGFGQYHLVTLPPPPCYEHQCENKGVRSGLFSISVKTKDLLCRLF